MIWACGSRVDTGADHFGKAGWPASPWASPVPNPSLRETNAHQHDQFFISAEDDSSPYSCVASALPTESPFQLRVVHFGFFFKLIPYF